MYFVYFMKGDIAMDIKETVIALSEVSGTSGSEENAAELALSMLREFAPDAAIINGNVIGHVGGYAINTIAFTI